MAENAESVRNKTLQELEGLDWGEPNYGSHLVTEAHRLWRIPLKQFRLKIFA